jgi:hypothetical protein
MSRYLKRKLFRSATIDTPEIGVDIVEAIDVLDIQDDQVKIINESSPKKFQVAILHGNGAAGDLAKTQKEEFECEKRNVKIFQVETSKFNAICQLLKSQKNYGDNKKVVFFGTVQIGLVSKNQKLQIAIMDK